VGILKRSAMTVATIGAAGAIVAGGTIPTMAAATSGVRYQVVQSVYEAQPNKACIATVLSAALSTGSPAYVSAMVQNTLTPACTSWLQSSVNGGAWTDVSPKQSLPGGQGPSNPAWYKTANYYAGPGTRVRACVQMSLPGVPPRCSGPVSLAASTATPASDSTSVYYAQSQHSVSINNGTGGSQCAAWLNSSTKSKAGTTQVSMTLLGSAVTPTCTTGWLESSTNNGKTWEQATPTYSLSILSGLEYAFSPAVADGTGNLVRACVQGNAAKKCSAAW
jgi:hypothetical protein